MKLITKIKISILKILFSVIELLSAKGNKIAVKHKLKLGIIILTLQSAVGQAQRSEPRTGCYATPTWNKSIFGGNNIILSEENSFKPLKTDNLSLRYGVFFTSISPGIELNYNFKENIAKSGLYFRYFPINGWWYSIVTELNCMFDMHAFKNNELAFSTGLIFYKAGYVGVEFAGEYVYNTNTTFDNEILGIIRLHFYINTRQYSNKYRGFKILRPKRLSWIDDEKDKTEE